MSPDILRLVILLAVFIAVLLFVEVAISTSRASRRSIQGINRRLALISRGVSREQLMVKLRRVTPESRLPPPLKALRDRLERMLSGAGFKISALATALILAGLTLATFLFILWLAYASNAVLNGGRILLAATLAAAVGLGLPILLLARLADRRRKQLVEQFPIALDIFVRGLRAGHPVAAALELVTSEMADPIGTEFGLVTDEVAYGAELRDALQSMADRCGIADMQMFVVSLSIQAETGGSLAEILENLAKVIRERASMLMKVRALSSEGRMTGLMLTLLPIGSLVGLFILRPSFYLDIAGDPIFVPGFSILLVAFVIGVLWIRNLVDLKV